MSIPLRSGAPIGIGGSGMLDLALKLHFKRIRPEVPWAFVSEHSFSFPSGHSVGAVVLYGILTYLLWSHLRAIWQRAAVILGALLLVIGIGRAIAHPNIIPPTASGGASRPYTVAPWNGWIHGA